MTTAPIPPAATTAAAKATSRLKGIGPLIGLASIALPAWLMSQSFKGAKDVWTQKVAGHHMDNEMKSISYGFGHYSGQPTMGGWAHRLYNTMLFGPFGFATTWHKVKTYTNGFVNNVILPNLIPIGIGIAGMYAGFGRKSIHDAAKRSANYLKPYMGNVPMKTVAEKTAVGIGKTLLSPIKGLYWSMDKGRAKFALPILGLLGFGAYRFGRVWNHDEQHDFWRDFTNMKH